MISNKVVGWFKGMVGASVLALAGGAAHATVILEGSDAIGFHRDQSYSDQVWSAIGGSSPLPIAVIGDSTSGLFSDTHAIQLFNSVSAAGALNQYVAVWLEAGGSCCSENDALVSAPADRTALATYLSAGGTIMLNDYTGGSAYDFIVGTTGGVGNAHVAGVSGGYPSGLNCSDGEAVTASGLTNGFTQPVPIGCWTHQAYDEAFFGALGFSLSFFDAPTDVGLPPGAFSSLLSNGLTVTGVASSGVPEPESIALLAIGLLGAAATSRVARRKAAK